MTKDNTQLEYAYDFCQQIARSHYENFPVASFLVPKRLRSPITAIYAFARSADDIADESDKTSQERLNQLEQYQSNLDDIANKAYQSCDPVFIALADTVNQHQLPIALLSDLLTAFKQDITQKDYKDWDEILNYCQNSANPIGRLLLHLEQHDSDTLFKQSDAICSALQLINFFQDIKQDYIENGRVYLPHQSEDLTLLSKHIEENNSAALAPLIRKQYIRTLRLFEQGYTLGTELQGLLGWEIRSITLSGLLILKRLSQQANEDLFSRPRITKLQFISQSTLALASPLFLKRCECLFRQIAEYNKNN